jgi:O-antigen ligase
MNTIHVSLKPLSDVRSVLLSGRAEQSSAETRAFDSVLFYGLSGLSVFGPLAFGAVEPWAVFALQFAAALLFLIWAARQVVSGSLHVAFSPLYVPLAGFAVVVGLQLLLHVPRYLYGTISAAEFSVLYGFVFFVAVQVLFKDNNLQRILGLLGVFGFLLALFAIIQHFAGNDRIYWLRPVIDTASIFGPYVNRNHFAGALELLAPLPVVLATYSHRSMLERFASMFAGGVMVAAVFLSGSRGGMVSVVAEFLFFTGCLLLVKKNSRQAWIGIAIFCLLSAGLLAWVGTVEMAERLGTLADQFNSATRDRRSTILRDSVVMVKQRPLLGWGLGQFPSVYPQFRSFYTDFFVNAAHDDYLQVLVETGFLGFAMAMLFIALLYREGFRRWREGSLANLAALVGCTGLLVHSFVDFNLQIPANAVMFFLLSAAACSKSQRLQSPVVRNNRTHLMR